MFKNKLATVDEQFAAVFGRVPTKPITIKKAGGSALDLADNVIQEETSNNLEWVTDAVEHCETAVIDDHVLTVRSIGDEFLATLTKSVDWFQDRERFPSDSLDKIKIQAAAWAFALMDTPVLTDIAASNE